MKKLLLLCSLFILSSLQAMNQLQIQPLVLKMTEENRSVSPNDGICTRLVRNTAICMTHPRIFFDIPKFRNDSRKKLLLQHVMEKPLVLNGKDISSLNDGNQLRKAYKKEQKKQIGQYLKRLDRFNIRCGRCTSNACNVAVLVDVLCGTKLTHWLGAYLDLPVITSLYCCGLTCCACCACCACQEI